MDDCKPLLGGLNLTLRSMSYSPPGMAGRSGRAGAEGVDENYQAELGWTAGAGMEADEAAVTAAVVALTQLIGCFVCSRVVDLPGVGRRAVLLAGPGRHCSPRHTVKIDSRDQGSKCGH